MTINTGVPAFDVRNRCFVLVMYFNLSSLTQGFERCVPELRISNWSV